MSERSNPAPNITIHPDGFAVLDGIEVKIPNVDIYKVLGSGANGVVFRARHQFLDREIAVKLWLTLRRGDRRNKFQQGIEEARKSAQVGQGHHTIQIYDAGSVSGFFYATMDYFEGVTLKKWLQGYSPPLDLRALIATTLVSQIDALAAENLFHGDLHADNILIGADYAESSPNRKYGIYSRIPSLKIVDFGTSLFTSRDYSVRRHWKVFNETFVRLLVPLDINKIWSKFQPKSLKSDAMCSWYGSFLGEIESMLVSIGADWLVHPQEWIDRDHAMWAGHPLPWPEPYKNKRVATELARLVDQGMLKLDRSELGEWK